MAQKRVLPIELFVAKRHRKSLYLGQFIRQADYDETNSQFFNVLEKRFQLLFQDTHTRWKSKKCFLNNNLFSKSHDYKIFLWISDF